MSNKKTRGLQNTQDNRINSDLSIDPDFSSEGIISTEKKQLALAQLRIAKHQEMITNLRQPFSIGWVDRRGTVIEQRKRNDGVGR